MTGRTVFVDANILVYAKQTDEPVKQAIAAENIRRLASAGRICTSMQVVNECYRVLTRKLRPPLQRDVAWNYVSTFFDWNPCAVDLNLALRAREVEQRYGLNWWDCLIVAAAQMQNCEVLLTEDLDEQGSYGGVKVCNPFRLAMCSAESELAEFAALAAELTSVGERIHPGPAIHPRRRISPSRPRGTCEPWARSGSGGIH
jgi:predicted nucleic acid-binding protein